MATKYQHIFVIGISWIVQYVTSIEFCTPENIESYDCSQKGIQCEIIKDPTCSGTNLNADSALNYPGPVTDFTVQPHNIALQSQTLTKAKVDMTWGLPANDTYRYLEGFEVRVSYNEKTECYILNLTIGDMGWDNDYDYKFSLNCNQVPHNENGYTIEVTSLPKAPFSDMKASALLKVISKHRDEHPGECTNPTNTQCWDTHVVVYNEICHSRVRVLFLYAPPELGIEYYTISLLHIEKYYADGAANVTIGSGEFGEGTIKTTSLSLPLTNRHIRVIPKGTVCLNNRCRDSKSVIFNITTGSQKQCTFIPPKASNQKLSDAYLIGIIVGSIVAAAIVTSAIAICAKNRCQTEPKMSQIDGSMTDIESSTSNTSKKPLVKKRRKRGGIGQKEAPFSCVEIRKVVLLLYSNDSPRHQHVIGSFARFLGKQGCNVIFDRLVLEEIRDNKTIWLQGQMERCDYILLINSEGTYRKVHAFMNNLMFSTYDIQTSSLGDMFSLAFDIIRTDLPKPNGTLMSKILMAHFHYTPREFICIPLEPLHEKANYELMEHFDDLMSHIHGKTVMSFYNQEYDPTQDGNVLETAIHYANKFILSDPYWFFRINGEPTPKICITHHNHTNFDRGHICRQSSRASSSFSQNSSQNGVTQGFSSYFKVPPNLDDVTTIDGSVMGEMIADLNQEGEDSGFESSHRFSSGDERRSQSFRMQTKIGNASHA